jgi:hypothetical protein
MAYQRNHANSYHQTTSLSPSLPSFQFLSTCALSSQPTHPLISIPVSSPPESTTPPPPLDISTWSHLQHHIPVIDCPNPVAVQLLVILIEHCIRLAVPAAQALRRAGAEVPKGAAVEVNSSRVGDKLVESHAAFRVGGATSAERRVAREERVCKGRGSEQSVALALPVGTFTLFEADIDVFGAVDAEPGEDMMLCHHVNVQSASSSTTATPTHSNQTTRQVLTRPNPYHPRPHPGLNQKPPQILVLSPHSPAPWPTSSPSTTTTSASSGHTASLGRR